ncbi:type II toxin-antitoxin system RelE/ParE family toxin [Urbifossiella limnaea]|uniref:Plasmid stabilization system protein n=1 Tax=Urbifossiella limnaea TaxID=2528023 RepID=A0A517Y3H4_9BACT|nr:type II toxin-antitoxin system RelE/ParE family toxin [Urbifossiella limnaea]QDU24291.1 Plasmid stabilization system protein [Urbifossiella limnaea]
MTPVVFLPDAQDDIDTVYAGYEARLVGLGGRFLRAVSRTVALIEVNPHLYGEVAPGIRAALTRRFPLVVYYRADPAGVVVIAVRHGRDDPAAWQGRV